MYHALQGCILSPFERLLPGCLPLLRPHPFSSPLRPPFDLKLLLKPPGYLHLLSSSRCSPRRRHNRHIHSNPYRTQLPPHPTRLPNPSSLPYNLRGHDSRAPGRSPLRSLRNRAPSNALSTKTRRTGRQLERAAMGAGREDMDQWDVAEWIGYD